MTQVLYLHVGAPKSGTTFIQQVLDHNCAVLAEAGVLVLGPRLDLIHAAMVVRGDGRLDDLPDSARGAWQRILEEARAWNGHAAVASYELFANASADQVRAALADLDGIDVHVVVTARDLGRAIGSSWQEQLKFGVSKPLERWSVPQESVAQSEWGWRTMQPANVAARWGATLAPDHVHVVTVPAEGRDSAQLWQRFAQACALDEIEGLDLEVERANEALGVVEAEVLRRVNKALGGRIKGGRQKSLWVRDLLAHQVLAPLGRETIGQTPEHAAEAAREADAAITAITAAGYAVHGDLEDLRPRPVQGRLPSEVGEHEVAESAVLALADLLVRVREQAQRADAAGSGRAAAKGAARATMRRLAAPYRDRRAESLERRIAELEAEVEKSRALHLRVATLSDVVSELLLPAAHQDGELTKRALREYRQRSL